MKEPMSIKVYPTLHQRLSVLDSEKIDLLTHKELVYDLETIMIADEIAVTGEIGAAIETLKAATQEPIHDGDLVSKTTRNILVDKGLMIRTLYKGEEGYNTVTLRGNWVLKLLQLYVK